MTTKKIDYLKEDELLNSQKFVCISFVSPDGIKNCNVRALKIRGSYSTREEAEERAKELQKFDSDFHIFVGEVGKWLPFDPKPEEVKDEYYYEEELQKLMKGYKDNREQAQQVEKERKDGLIREAAVQDKKIRDTNTRDRLKQKLEHKKQQKMLEEERTNNTEISKNMESTVQEEEFTIPTELEQEFKAASKKTDPLEVKEKEVKETLIESQKELNDKEGELLDIDSKINKLKQLYKQANKK